MKLRAAKKRDIPELLKLLKHLFTQEAEFSFNEALHVEALKEIISDPSNGKIFVALKDKKVVAMANLLFLISTAKGSRVAILEDMIVLPKYRGKKVGSTLLNYVIKYVEDNGISRVTLLSDHDNFGAHRFYEKFNFKKSKMIVLRRS